MNTSIQSVIHDWETSKSPYSFEMRIHPPLNATLITPNTPFVEMVFIIDVSGFYYDEACTKPIKLHYERVISIDRFNSSQAYADDLHKDLALLTQSAYDQFHKILSATPNSIYTTDPKYMK